MNRIRDQQKMLENFAVTVLSLPNMRVIALLKSIKNFYAKITAYEQDQAL